MLATRRTEVAIFATLFAAYAWFHQGGGWNQNARFDQVRSVVESGDLAINDYLVYLPTTDPADGPDIRRGALTDPELASRDTVAANTLDVAAFGERIYPNKPPGTTLIALPAYAIISGVARTLGIDLDNWKAITVAAWLTSLFSVGIVGALGGVIFLRVSTRLIPWAAPHHHAGAALAFGLGTLVFPYSTMLYDHTPVAVLSLASFALLVPGTDRASRSRCVAAGVAAGLAILANYSAAITAAFLALYAERAHRSARAGVAVAAGAAVPVFALLAYHAAAFGGPFVVANAYQSEIFAEPESRRLLGVFGAPNLAVAVKLLVSRYRGLFVTSPVLVMGVLGLALLARRGRRVEAALFAVTFAAFVLLNASFNKWDAGASFGPRYLIPAIPFLCLPLAAAFHAVPRIGLLLGAASIAIMLLFTAVDPQMTEPARDPLFGYAIPVFRHGGLVGVQASPRRAFVSVNPLGVYESTAFSVFPPGSRQARMNSFNVGELVWPESRVSVIPIVVIIAAGAWAATRGYSRR